MSNNILSYTSRDYKSIFEDLKSAIPSLTDLWTNTSDGDPGIVLVKLMSGLGDMLSFNLDKQALEYYSSTVTQRKNAARIYDLIGYKMHWYQSATNTITITNSKKMPTNCQVVVDYDAWMASGGLYSGEEYEKLQMTLNIFKLEYPPNIPSNTKYYVDIATGELKEPYILVDNNSQSGVDFSLRPVYNAWVDDINNALQLYTYIAYPNKNLTLTSDVYNDVPYLIIPTTSPRITDGSNPTILPDYIIKPGHSTDIKVVQGTLVSTPFTSRNLRNNRFYFQESAIDDSHMWLAYEVDNENKGFVTLVDNILTQSDAEVHFEFKIDEFDHPYVEISSFWKDYWGDSVSFTLYFIRTMGMFGNITSNYLKNIGGIPKSQYTIIHPTNSVPMITPSGDLIAEPGKHPELPKEAYLNSLNWITTFNTIVTIYDFERFCTRQPGISNTMAVDGQRADDLNNAVKATADSYSLSQLQSFAALSSGNIPDMEDIDTLRDYYCYVKNVNRDDYTFDGTIYDGSDENSPQKYIAYGVQLLPVYENYDLMETINITDDINETYELARIKQVKLSETPYGDFTKGYWVYKINDDTLAEEQYDNEQIDRNIANYLTKQLNDVKVATTYPFYSGIRLFPWRCCGVLHLKYPVTKEQGDIIIQSVIQHLRNAFHPANLEFGKQIKYMDVINVVTNAHDAIRYFDAGLGNKKLIDIDNDIDFSFFNDTSLMYYAQRFENESFPIQLMNGGRTDMVLYGNNEMYINPETLNPYYQLLSIAPEYIIET